jgi:hypothetical protein
VGNCYLFEINGQFVINPVTIFIPFEYALIFIIKEHHDNRETTTQEKNGHCIE